MNVDETRMEFRYRSREAWDAMYADCENARVSIEMEQYIFMDDAAGRRFLELFEKKAQEGLRVRLIFDGVGCRGLLKNERIARIRRAGGSVQFYNALWWHHIFFPSRWLPRTHVKTLLVDGRVAWTGSACLWGRMAGWHELHARFTGEVTAQVAENFASAREFMKTKRKSSAPPARPETDPFRYVVTEPRFGPSRIYTEMLAEFARAKRRIRIVTPYFLPTRRLRKALEKAAARGVRVEILLSARSDVRFADCVSCTYFPRLLARGIRILLFEGEILHAKYVMVDDGWATVGSVNIDYLSLTKNREAGLIIRDADTVAALWEGSAPYARQARQADMEYLKGIPLPWRVAGRLGLYLKEML